MIHVKAVLDLINSPSASHFRLEGDPDESPEAQTTATPLCTGLLLIRSFASNKVKVKVIPEDILSPVHNYYVTIMTHMHLHFHVHHMQ